MRHPRVASRQRSIEAGSWHAAGAGHGLEHVRETGTRRSARPGTAGAGRQVITSSVPRPWITGADRLAHRAKAPGATAAPGEDAADVTVGGDRGTPRDPALDEQLRAFSMVSVAAGPPWFQSASVSTA